ncbi:hypothetical protein KSF_036430 [Reticulibacter mediterranei]|uniref:Uncharacterized protein n=1 Tax=Reticulibacter mediterranei TaxID=2778369 RepID=A0A8J3N2W6_9CHLR|nr:hypothetical protein KSF_036430 [Reticulibacter mediterranei]
MRSRQEDKHKTTLLHLPLHGDMIRNGRRSTGFPALILALVGNYSFTMLSAVIGSFWLDGG